MIKSLFLKKNLIFLIIVLIQVVNIIYISDKKKIIDHDEIYSYHFVSVIDNPSINADKGDNKFLNTWHDSNYFNDYFTISDSELFQFAAIIKNCVYDVHPPIFYLLLHIVCALFSQNFFSIWTGVGLNIVFFVFTLIVLYKLSKKMLRDNNLALCVCLLYGFSIGAINSVLYIRMYMILTFISILFFYIHILLYYRIFENTSKKIFLCFLLYITCIIGIMTHYYFLIFAFGCCVYFIFYILKKKKFKDLLLYVFSMISSLFCSCILWPDILHDIFEGGRGKEAFLNLKSYSTTIKNIFDYIDIVNKSLFSGLAILIGSILIILIFINRKKIKLKKSCDFKLLFYIMFIIIFYALMISLIAPYRTDRYIFNLYPFIILFVIYVLKSFVKKGFCRVGFIFIYMLIILIGYKSIDIKYLNESITNNYNLINEYADYNAILITKDNRRFISCINSIYLRKHIQTLPLLSSDLNNINKYLNDESVVIYIDSYLEKEDILNTIKKNTKLKNIEFLFSNSETNVYFVNF